MLKHNGTMSIEKSEPMWDMFHMVSMECVVLCYKINSVYSNVRHQSQLTHVDSHVPRYSNININEYTAPYKIYV